MSEPAEEQKALQPYADAMKQDWDDRARENAKWYINTVKRDQSDEEFLASAKPDVEKFVFNDPVFTRGGDLKKMRLLEIGCGIGRMTQHLAEAFAEVYGTDVSGEMIRQGRERLRHLGNVHLSETNGCDFAMLPSDYFDRVFSVYVFQHVPDIEVVRSNIRDACRVLKPGGLFKFQTCAITAPEYEGVEKDTWTGASFPETEIRRIARETGARLVSILGVDTQYCWTILRKPAHPGEPKYTTANPEIKLFGRSDDPLIKQIPTSGDYAFLTLVVAGLQPEDVDANSMTVELGGHPALPCYVGAVGEEFAAALGDPGDQPLDRLVQVNLGVPNGAPWGRIEVRIRLINGETSEPVVIEMLEPLPVAPKINLISNAVDGGVDVHARGDKSRFRVFANGLDRTSSPENVRVHIGKLALKPISVSFVPANGVFMTVAQMPEEILPGETEIRLQFNDQISQAVRLRIR